MNNILERGAFLLSIDLELGRSPAMIRLSREAISHLLDLMARFEIRATWAVIGNTLIDQPGSSIPAKNYIDIVGQILNCHVPQEIGCHTFSHLRAGDPGCSQQRFESELEACQLLAGKFGITLRSFVFPWNSVAHLNCLHQYGFHSFRGPGPDWFAGLPASIRRLSHLIDHWMCIPAPVVSAKLDNGVWNLPASYYYVCGAGWGKIIPIGLRLRKVRKGIRSAVKQRRLFHLWFHPFDLVKTSQKWLEGLDKIFQEVRFYRESGLLDNPTMGELADSLDLRGERDERLLVETEVADKI